MIGRQGRFDEPIRFDQSTKHRLIQRPMTYPGQFAQPYDSKKIAGLSKRSDQLSLANPNPCVRDNQWAQSNERDV